MTGKSSGERVGTILIFSGLAFGVIGAVLTIALGEIWPLALIAVGFSDMFVGMLFRSGRIGQTADANPNPAADDLGSKEGFGFEQTENPVARED